MDRVSAEFAKLGARGITILTGSGDWGTGCGLNGRYRSDFPSSSPYIVSTGATTFLPDRTSPGELTEVGVTFSSGGFSDHFTQPAFQKGAVDAFLAKTKVSRKLFNIKGRGFPDVSTVGVNFQVINSVDEVFDCGTYRAPYGVIVSSSPTLTLALGVHCRW